MLPVATVNIKTNLIQASETVVDVAKQTSSPEKVSLAIKITNLARHIGSTSSKFLSDAKHLPAIGVMKLVTLGLVPLAVYDIGASIFSAHSGTANEKVDAALGVVAAVGTLGDTAATAAEGLMAVGIVATQALGWVTPLVIVSAVLEGVGMVLVSKSLAETHRFSKVFNQTAALEKPVEEYTLEDFSNARQLIETKSQEKSFVGKHFKTSADKLNSRLAAIETEAQAMLTSEDPTTVLEGKKKLQTTMQALSKRMTIKKWSNALSLLSGSIGFIALGILFTPFVPAGFALLALSGVLSLVNFFADKAVTSRFEKEIGIK